MRGYEEMMRRQKALGDFGEFALRSDDLNAVLMQVCRIVAEVLGTVRAKVLEIQEDGTSLLVRAGVGWNPNIVGKLRLPMDEHSSETFAIREGKPIIMGDLRQEDRFGIPDFMKDAGVMALANVPIFLPGQRTYGLLQVDATEPRDFGDKDTEFLRTYTTILGPVIDRLLHLRASKLAEERFRLIVASTRDYAIFLTDAEDRITDWLPSAEAVYGFTAAEAIGQPAAMLFMPEDREHGEPEKEIETARREGAAPNVRWHLSKDGERVFIDGAVSALYDADGSVRGFLKIGQDVTARRRSEAALRESEARHRLLVGSWAQALWEVDANGAVVTDSPSWRGYTGQTLEEWLGYGWLDAIHPDDRAYAERQWRQAIAARRLVNAESRLRTPDGGWRWTNVRAAPVLDPRGDIEKWAGMNIDIGARKQAEAALRESDERFAQFAASSSDGLWIRDAATLAMEYTSPAIETIYGVPPNDLLGNMERWAALILPEDRDTAIAHILRAQSGVSVTHEFRIRRPADGTIRWVRNTDFPLRDGNGEVQRIGGIAQDVTEARMASERQDVLIAELQHRTRNLIAVVKGVANDTMWQTGQIGAFRTAFSDRLAALSRVQGLLSRSEVEPITIEAMLRLELDALGADMASDRVTLAGPEVFMRPSTVQTLALALHELATNARKYGALSHEGGHLAVTWRKRSEADQCRLVIEWIETGLEQALDRPASERTGGGYGRELIEQALPHALGARTSYALSASGVRCTIDLAVRPGKSGS